MESYDKEQIMKSDEQHFNQFQQEDTIIQHNKQEKVIFVFGQTTQRINLKNWQNSKEYLQFFYDLDLSELFWQHQENKIDKNKKYTLEQLLTTQHLYQNVLQNLHYQLQNLIEDNIQMYKPKSNKNQSNSTPEEVRISAINSLDNFQIFHLNCSYGMYKNLFQLTIVIKKAIDTIIRSKVLEPLGKYILKINCQLIHVLNIQINIKPILLRNACILEINSLDKTFNNFLKSSQSYAFYQNYNAHPNLFIKMEYSSTSLNSAFSMKCNYVSLLIQKIFKNNQK